MHYAEEGAVIVRSEASGRVEFKYKCEACGQVSSNTQVTTVRGGVLRTGFRCNCGNNQAVSVGWSG
jgi:lysyl-tRNA synthetase class I